MEIMAFDEELNEIAQVLDEVVAHLLLSPPTSIKFHYNRTSPKTPYHT